MIQMFNYKFPKGYLLKHQNTEYLNSISSMNGRLFLPFVNMDEVSTFDSIGKGGLPCLMHFLR